MTVAEMQFAIEEEFRAALQVKKPSVKVGRAIPSTITPLAWHFQIDGNADKFTREEFAATASLAGQQLATEGLEHGCDQFASLRVQDREAAQVRGHMKVHKRERAFIVHALGWKGEAK